MTQTRSIAGRSTGSLQRIATRILGTCGRLAESHPYSWKFAWETVHRLSFLLPHDKSYNALKHFVTAAPVGLFVDVGANDGISALSFRKFSKSYRILSLEPNTLLEPALQKIKSLDSKFDYLMIGAGSVSAQVRLFMPVYRGILLHTFTSGSRDQVERAVQEQFGSKVARRTAVEVINGEVVRLDDLGLDPAIVKIDAEGFDYDVLLGMAGTIARTRPFIVIEVAWTERNRIAEFLNNHDYALVAYDIASDSFNDSSGERASRMPNQKNLFAIPREKSGALPFCR